MSGRARARCKPVYGMAQSHALSGTVRAWWLPTWSPESARDLSVSSAGSLVIVLRCRVRRAQPDPRLLTSSLRFAEWTRLRPHTDRDCDQGVYRQLVGQVAAEVRADRQTGLQGQGRALCGRSRRDQGNEKEKVVVYTITKQAASRRSR